MRLRFLCGRDDLFVARARPAVADVRRDGAVEEGRILRDHADRRTQALLRDLRDVLAVDENAALLGIEEAQQQVDDRRFARARTADQTDALAGLDPELEAFEHCLGPPVAETHVLEPYLAARDLERLRAGLVDAGMRHGDGLHAFLHHADIFKDGGDFPAHPAGHVRELPGERQRSGDDSGAHGAARPQPDADRRGGNEERGVHRGEAEMEARDELHMPAHGSAVLVDRLAHIRIFVGKPREELHREHVGVAVDHARHDERACF